MDRSRNPEPVTFHDSCNNARSCGLFEEPRELIHHVCMEFREMYPNRAENYCCTGGGGAMSMAEYTPRRLHSARIKAEQLKATGAKWVVTSCHNCVDGLNDLIRHYKLDMKVTQLVNLVSNAAVVPAARVVVEVPAAVEAFAKPLKGRRILVVDDEPDVCTFLRAVFEDNGAKVQSAGDGDQGIQAARTWKPDLITLDLNMPGRDGGQVYAELRRDPALKGIPVVIITGKPELRKLIYERPVPPPEGYLDKPVTEETLLVNIRKVLEVGAHGTA